MNSNKLRQLWTASCLLGLLMPPATQGQSSNQQLNNLKAKMDAIKAAVAKIPAAQRKALSGDAQNLIHLAENWSGNGPVLGQAAARTQGGVSIGSPRRPSNDSGMIPVSNPNTDFLASRVTGFTQSETSTAWCGSNVVVGFNDSGSVIETFDGLLAGINGLSVNGVALSTDQGRTFLDLGSLNPGPDPSGFLAGDPVIGCADNKTFYYSSLFESGFFPDLLTSVSVSKSMDGGATFGNPVAAASKSAFTHFLDKDWMAVDPTNPNRVFVTYTDFDSSGAVCVDASGFPAFRNAIELVSSSDGGATWSSPSVLQEFCNFAGFVQFSQVVIGSGGEVYVAWEMFPNFPPNSILLRKSTDHGFTFGPMVTAASIQPVGDPFAGALQGGFRAGADISLAVDRSGTATNGNLYLTWQDGGNVQAPSFGFFPDTYNFSDVLISRSSDGGATWSVPVQIGDNTERAFGAATDAYQPGVAVDKTGKVGVCFYDRRRDPMNFMIDRYCATSTDAGATWANHRQSSPSWAPWHATDIQINPLYMGDYDVTASDFTNSTRGFVGAFQFMNSGGGSGNSKNGEPSDNSIPVPNPDVLAVRLK